MHSQSLSKTVACAWAAFPAVFIQSGIGGSPSIDGVLSLEQEEPVSSVVTDRSQKALPMQQQILYGPSFLEGTFYAPQLETHAQGKKNLPHAIPSFP